MTLCNRVKAVCGLSSAWWAFQNLAAAKQKEIRAVTNGAGGSESHRS